MMDENGVYYASGCSETMRDYIAEYHAYERDSNGFPLVNVREYFADGGKLVGIDAQSDEWELNISDVMREARDAGAHTACFVD
jgi:hypothetical protein